MKIIVFAAALVFSLAGCASEPEPTSDSQDDAAPTTPDVPIPEPIHHDGSHPGVSTPQGSMCGPDGCSTWYTFTIEQNLSVEITLVSNQDGVTDPTGATGIETDYDLSLYQGSSTIGNSVEFGDTPDVVAADLGPGTYDVEVYTYQDAGGSYDLDIVFASTA